MPVIQIERQYSVVVVPSSSPARTVTDLIALAKATPGGLKFASPGNATTAHLALTLFSREAGIEMLHVPYKGTIPSVTALLSGDVDLTICGIYACGAHMKSGKLRPLATASARRVIAWPDIPTFAELGYPGVQITDWMGIVAPAGTPTDVIDRLHVAIAKIVATPELRERLDAVGMEPSGAGPVEFAAVIHADIARWSKLVREARIRAD